MHAKLCVSVCVCVRERERERKRERDRVRLCAREHVTVECISTYTCTCVCVCVYECVWYGVVCVCTCRTFRTAVPLRVMLFPMVFCFKIKIVHLLSFGVEKKVYLESVRAMRSKIMQCMREHNKPFDLSHKMVDQKHYH